MLMMLMLDGAVCLMCLMRLLMWLLAHAVDGGVDMDGCFVLALCFFGRTNECAKLSKLSLGVASRCPYGGPLNNAGHQRKAANQRT